MNSDLPLLRPSILVYIQVASVHPKNHSNLVYFVGLLLCENLFIFKLNEKLIFPKKYRLLVFLEI